MDLESIASNEEQLKSLFSYLAHSLMVLNPHSGHFLLNDSGHYIRLAQDTICCIVASKNYSTIICKDIFSYYRKYTTAESLKVIANKLDAEAFLRVHKSYIVNIVNIYDCVKEGRGGIIHFDKHKKIPEAHFSVTYSHLLKEKGLII